MKNVFKLHRKNNQRISISQSSWFSWVSAATAARSGCIRQQTCMGCASEKQCPCSSSVVLLKSTHLHVFFWQTRAWILCFLSLTTSYTSPTSISFSALTNRHPTPCPSLQACVFTAACLVLFLSAGPSTVCNRYSKWSKSRLAGPLQNSASADVLLCGHQKLLSCLIAFVYPGLSNSALVRTQPR